MSTITNTPPLERGIAAPRFANGEEFLHSLGDVPMSRIIWNPLPGTATEQDLLDRIDRQNKMLCELVDGTLVEKPMGYEESLIALTIAFALKTFVNPRKLGIVSGPDGTLRMAIGRLRSPDVSFISVNDLPGGKRPKDRVPKLPPTLAVEIISDGNTAEEMQQKIREYFDSASKLVWLVYPKTKTVAVYDAPTEQPTQILAGSDTLSGGAVLPGFTITLKEVFTISDFE